MLWYPVGTFLLDPSYSYNPVICIESSRQEDGPPKMLLSKSEYWGDYYCRGEALEKANLSIYEKLAVLGTFKPWFFKIHKDIVAVIMIETALELLKKP
jgi:hypothetical protein